MLEAFNNISHRTPSDCMIKLFPKITKQKIEAINNKSYESHTDGIRVMTNFRGNTLLSS